MSKINIEPLHIKELSIASVGELNNWFFRLVEQLNYALDNMELENFTGKVAAEIRDYKSPVESVNGKTGRVYLATSDLTNDKGYMGSTEVTKKIEEAISNRATYENGSFTPVFYTARGNTVSCSSDGEYIKIGRLVYIRATIMLSIVNPLYAVGGLPFAIDTGVMNQTRLNINCAKSTTPNTKYSLKTGTATTNLQNTGYSANITSAEWLISGFYETID